MVLNPITAVEVVVLWPFTEDPAEAFLAIMTASLADRRASRVVKYCRTTVGRDRAMLRAPRFRFDMACSNLLSVGATVYLMDDRRKLWRAELTAVEPKVEGRDMAFALPQGEIRWRHYFVESLGHALLMVSDDHHKRLQLYRLNWDARWWMRMPTSGLSDNVLLLGRVGSAVVPASAAAGHLPGMVLVVCQPWRSTILHMVLNFCGGGGEQPWFWTESRLEAGLDDD
uniref:KIB1-4 beta-propeller domain-containing protein n=1 Tax=Setaria italica TaxID=4555 RepID=K3YD68_SETIT